MPYPDTLPSLTNPLAGDARVGHALLHSDVNDAIEALAAKVGTGTSTPDTFNHLFVSQGSGETSWTPIASVASLFAEALDANGGGHTILQKATVPLSSAQILDLHNTPVTLVAAPGAGRVLAVSHVITKSASGTVAYVNGSYAGPQVTFGDGDYYIVEEVGALTNNWSMMQTKFPTSNVVSLLSHANKAIKAYTDAAFTDGDFALDITVWYSIEDVP